MFPFQTAFWTTFRTAMSRVGPIVVLLACALPGQVPAVTDAPEEIRAQSNPFTLSEREVRYYARHFKAKCARCHGPDGAGSGDEAAKQSVPPRDLTDAAYMRTRSDGQLFWQIREGGGPDSPMPGFGPTSAQGWPDEKIWRMAAFVRRFAAAPSP